MSDVIKSVMEAFVVEGEFVEAREYGDGHINDTYKVVMKDEGQSKPYLLQRINHQIFTDPPGLVENIDKVTGHIRHKLQVEGVNPKREVLELISTRDGKKYHLTKDGHYYRAYVFIEDAATYLLVEKPEHMYYAGKAFGTFQKLLADFPEDQLIETIPDFHHTVKRYEVFRSKVDENPFDRVDSAIEEIKFVINRKDMMGTLLELYHKGLIPKRVTHNDTKFNNVMIDDSTGEGICVVDLDTVMPGLSLYDFGDAIRSGTNKAKEDEKDLSMVSVDLMLFEQYTKGYLEAAGQALVEAEIEHLVTGALLMTLECGMRFLTDYLDGDNYFKTAYNEHNLIRCRNQFALVKDMEMKKEEMEAIVNTYMRLYIG